MTLLPTPLLTLCLSLPPAVICPSSPHALRPGPFSLQQDAAASADASYGNVAMAGQDVFKFAVRSVPSVIDAALTAAGLSTEDVDWLVMHQANQRILDAAAQRLGLPPERVRWVWGEGQGEQGRGCRGERDGVEGRKGGVEVASS